MLQPDEYRGLEQARGELLDEDLKWIITFYKVDTALLSSMVSVQRPLGWFSTLYFETCLG